MSRSLPWADIRSPERDYNVRLIPEHGAVPLYWGKDAAGHCLLIVDLDGDHSDQFRRDHTPVHGIRVDLRTLDATSSQGLVLTLEKHIDQDLFFGLCETLIKSVQQTKDAHTALSVTLAHIKRWKAFLAGRKTRLLSAEEVRGLFGELHFLRELYRQHLPPTAAIQAWCGPERVHQDFIFGNTAVETKALSGRERNSVRISSEDQLESVCDDLFLTIFRLGDLPDSDRALSLNDAVHRIEGELVDAEALEEFSSRLAAYGYVEMREYDQPRFVVTAQNTFRVSSDFPRLTRSSVPDGIARVSYEVELEKIAPFECETAEIWGGA